MHLTSHTEKVYVAGHTGLVGSAIVRRLKAAGFSNLVLRSFEELDLRDGAATDRFFQEERPDFVVLAAAKVGGIMANATYPVDFLAQNLSIELNVILSSFAAGVKRLLFLGSSCIYPKLAPQPLREEYLLTGPLEPTNEWYAIAKIAGIKLCQAYSAQYEADFFSAMPTNVYGPGDNFDLKTSHVLPALLRKFHEAKLSGEEQVTVWGSGEPLREFIHSDDLADGLVFLLQQPRERVQQAAPDGIFNIGVGTDLSIGDLARLIKEVAGFEGEIVFDPSKPDGTPRKLMDVSRMSALGWTAPTSLREGVARVYQDYAASNHVAERSVQPTTPVQ